MKARVATVLTVFSERNASGTRVDSELSVGLQEFWTQKTPESPRILSQAAENTRLSTTHSLVMHLRKTTKHTVYPVSDDKPTHLSDTRPTYIIKGDYASRPKHTVYVKEIKQHVVKCMRTVHESEIEFDPTAFQFGERQMRELVMKFDQLPVPSVLKVPKAATPPTTIELVRIANYVADVWRTRESFADEKR